MKHRILYGVLFAIVFSFTVMFTSRIDAQSIDKNGSSLTMNAGMGYGSFSQAVPVWDDMFGYPSGTEAETDNFINLALGLRFLLGTSLINSRLSIGAEYVGQRISGGEESEIVFIGGHGVVGPDQMIHTVQFIGDYLVGKISDNININAGGGIGMLFFENIDTRMEWDMGGPKDSDESTVQFAVSGRLIVPIRVSSKYTIGPEIRLLKSFDQEKVFLVQFLVDLTCMIKM